MSAVKPKKAVLTPGQRVYRGLARRLRKECSLASSRGDLYLRMGRPSDLDRLHASAKELLTLATEILERRCRVCGCTQYDCGQCVEKTGDACEWVELDLCSACKEG